MLNADGIGPVGATPRYTVVKLGGSVITNRNGFQEFDYCQSDKFARCFATALGAGLSKVILILGGGSFAHPVMQRYGISSIGRHTDTKVLFELSASLSRLKEIFIDTLRNHGISAIPFEALGLLTTHGGDIDKVFVDPINMSASLGFVPVLSGGLVIDKQMGFTAFSSDRIPLALLECVRIDRFIVLTDQPGIRAGRDDSTIFGEVTPHNYRRVRELISPSSRIDFSEGMRGKFDALIEMAKLGVGSVIGDGRNLKDDYFAALFAEVPPGTSIEPW